MRQDVRYALRTLLKNPGFSIVAVLALALGMGANTAIFTVVNSVLLRPLPFHDADRLYRIGSSSSRAPDQLYNNEDPEYVALQRDSKSFESIGEFSGGIKNLTGAGDPASLITPEVTPQFWSVLGVQPLIGRTFGTGEENVALIGESLWRSRFHGDPSVIGRTIRLDSVDYVVIGVMPASFAFPAFPDRDTAAWIPAKVDPQNTHLAFRTVIAKLRPGVTPERAEAEINAIAAHAHALDPDMFREQRLRVAPLQETMVGKIRPALRILLGAVSLLLLIACVNVANLLLARGAGRDREIAVRCSLGATRVRLIRQLLTEGAVLSMAGGVIAVILAAWGVAALLSLAPPGMIPRFKEIHMDWRVPAFTFALAIASSFLFGLWPAIQASRNTIAESLRKGFGRVSSQTPGVRNALVVTEIALALILLIGAGLLTKSFLKLRAVDPGFRSEGLLTITVNLAETYRTTDQMRSFHTQALDKLRAMPGAVSAAAVNWLPLSPSLIVGSFSAADQIANRTRFNVTKPAVTPGYFQTMGIRLLRGREFTDQDGKNAPGVVIVGQSTAKRVWGTKDPIGKRIALDDNPRPQDWLTVVGVVDDVKQENLKQDAPPAIYQPLAQVRHEFFLQSMSYVVRSTAPMTVVETMARARLREVDARQPIFHMATMEDLLVSSTAEPRFYSRVLSSFSLIALALAVVGIYGVISYGVSQRTREIGIRVALGAEPRNILAGVLARNGMLVGLGIVLGIGGASALTRVLNSFLFEVEPTDAATFMAVTALLAAAALAATYIPARRATRVDAMEALRHE